jgi:uncharacterized protein YjbI with pentapeptide repeats
MMGLGVIPQRYIDFVDRLINNGETMKQIKNAIMKFELSPELKAKLSKAVSSLLNSMSGSGRRNKKMSGAGLRGAGLRGAGLRGAGLRGAGIFSPNVSAYGLARF